MRPGGPPFRFADVVSSRTGVRTQVCAPDRVEADTQVRRYVDGPNRIGAYTSRGLRFSGGISSSISWSWISHTQPLTVAMAGVLISP